ncbi:MAG: PQQ-binding-like beta-propeller repeat protein, partial [Planctomycetales bacterium]|nr:PQQ-binding-like beta-propeller repeat protein [Planctomycetales bacterium]
MADLRFALGLCFALTLAANVSSEEESIWNEFRGPNGAGVAIGCKPPTTCEPSAATWTLDLPPGHSSPVVAGDLVVLTAIENQILETIAVSRHNGQIVWRRRTPDAPIERVHKTSNPAASTPCADGERIYVYFGSFGLICYDYEGNEVWNKPIATPKSLYGMSCSPIVHGEHLIMVLDNDEDLPDSRVSRSKIIALNKRTGELIWETPRPFHRSGWSTPTIWKHDLGTELVVLGSGRFSGYDAQKGEQKWFVDGVFCETI